MSSYDILGNIAIVKFPFSGKFSIKEKKAFALNLLKKHKNLGTVVEKYDRVKGRLRTIKTRHLAGEKTLDAVYRENSCVFRMNIETCYFSPRLAEERKKISDKCRKGEKILVMFSGVAPFAIVIAKNNPGIGKVVCVELGRECHAYAEKNVKANKVSDKIELIQGDVKKVLPNLKSKKEFFERIIMARPNLKYAFLKEALIVAKRNTMIHYYGFCRDGEELEKLKEKLIEEARENKKKIKILNVERAGDIAPGKFRWRIDLKVV